MKKEVRDRIIVTDGLACSERGAAWTSNRTLTLHVKAGRTSDNTMAYHKKGVYDTRAMMIHQYSGFLTNHPDHCGWDSASNESVTMALESSGRPLTMWIPVIISSGLLISKERQGYCILCKTTRQQTNVRHPDNGARKTTF